MVCSLLLLYVLIHFFVLFEMNIQLLLLYSKQQLMKTLEGINKKYYSPSFNVCSQPRMLILFEYSLSCYRNATQFWSQALVQRVLQIELVLVCRSLNANILIGKMLGHFHQDLVLCTPDAVPGHRCQIHSLHSTWSSLHSLSAQKPCYQPFPSMLASRFT